MIGFFIGGIVLCAVLKRLKNQQQIEWYLSGTYSVLINQEELSLF